jgi:hypothetical protein
MGGLSIQVKIPMFCAISRHEGTRMRENLMGQFGPKQNNKTIGERSEAIIMAKLLEVGYGVLMPFGDNRRYDLVIEDADGKFYRIQCKTARLMNGGACVNFATASTYYHTKAGKTGFGREATMVRLIILRYILLIPEECIWFQSIMWGQPVLSSG